MWDDPQRALRDAEAVLDATPRPPDAALLDAALKLAVAGETLEQAKPAKRGFERGMSLARALHDDGAICILRGTEVFLAQAGGRLDAAVRHSDDAITFARSGGMTWCVARLLLGRGRMYSSAGRGADALAALLEAHRIFELLGDRAGMASVLSDLCWIYHRERDNPQSLQRAIDSGEAALAMLDAAQQRYLAATVHHNLAGAYFASHRLTQAREHVNRAFEFANAIGDEVGSGFIAKKHGEIEMEAGSPELALPLFDLAKAAFRRHDLQDMLVEASVGRVEALTALRRRAEATQELDATEPTRRKLNAAITDIPYYRSALRLSESFGDFEAALRASKALGAAQQRHVSQDNRKAANELQERFETQRKEAENLVLREQQRSAQSQRWLLLATLVLTLALLAVMGAYLFQQLRLRRRFAQLAARDDLTGMPNRRSILETARQVNADRRSSHESACVAILDIDHFKVVNDTYGHDVGDAALITFARVCGENLRGRDRLGRYGGEEFMLVLPGARLTDLPAVFERLQSGLRAKSVPGMPPDARLAFSMGSTLLQADEGIEQAIHRADEALYRAKREGRDQLAVAPTP